MCCETPHTHWGRDKAILSHLWQPWLRLCPKYRAPGESVPPAHTLLGCLPAQSHLSVQGRGVQSCMGTR